MKNCKVLAGPIAVSATEFAQTGDTIQLPDGDAEQLVRWGIVEILGDAVIDLDVASPPASAKTEEPAKAEAPKAEPAPVPASAKTEEPAKVEAPAPAKGK